MQNITPEVVAQIREVMNKMWMEDNISEEWDTAVIVPLYKSGDEELTVFFVLAALLVAVSASSLLDGLLSSTCGGSDGGVGSLATGQMGALNGLLGSNSGSNAGSGSASNSNSNGPNGSGSTSYAKSASESVAGSTSS
ncbi:hypothetical protein KQX54_007952 [Cotesia glomerata]|uniref:Uncharacterized protein n=1 Tax=Cotesia glomerata TaxID=32391 RepID=A0AAV7J2D0_COTGL|nr:hypothetical protein KQX54_007952 [Cotesia glomerata]